MSREERHPPPLLLPSSIPPPETGEESPRLDYRELSAALGDAPLLFPPVGPAGLFGKIEDRTASDLRQALLAYRRRGRVGAFVSLSEKVGLPLALLLGRRSRIPHVLIAHNLTSERKQRLQQRTGWLSRFTRVVVLCREQECYLREEARLPAERIRFVYDKVDHAFFTPRTVPGAEQRGHILSVGRERRDYETLRAAARLLPERRFIVVASSPWSRQQGGETSVEVPSNVCVKRGLPWEELRDLYAGAAAVVVPLEAGTRYAAGVNGVLEAMAMGRPTVVTHTPGIADYVTDGENACVVAAGDPAGLADALRRLGSDRERAELLGAAARRMIEAGRNLDSYTAALSGIVREAITEAGRAR